MNQILYEDMGEPEVKPKNTKNTLKFWGIILIIFGICIIGVGGYGLIKNANKTPIVANGVKPRITTSMQGTDEVRIYVVHDKAIDKLLYNWNDEADQIVYGGTRKEFEEIIPMPFGENTLNIRVLDINGLETIYSQDYVLDNGIDIQKPTIDLTVVESKNIKITASDETQIKFMTYRWNNDPEERIEEIDESGTKIIKEIPILKGENDLTVIAVDANNNTETKIQKFKAVTKPTIKVKQVGEDLTITVTDEVGVKRVEYTLNGTTQRLQFEESKTWEYTIKLAPGENEIIIKALNTGNAEADTFHGKATYAP